MPEAANRPWSVESQANKQRLMAAGGLEVPAWPGRFPFANTRRSGLLICKGEVHEQETLCKACVQYAGATEQGNRPKRWRFDNTARVHITPSASRTSMRLIYAGFAIFVLTALPLLILGRSLATELICLGGGLVAMVLLVVGATKALWRVVRG